MATASEYIELALAADEAGDYDAAIGHYRRALGRMGDSPVIVQHDGESVTYRPETIESVIDRLTSERSRNLGIQRWPVTYKGVGSTGDYS